MNSIFDSFSIPFKLVAVMWGVFFMGNLFGFQTGILGVYPREWFGLPGIISMPLVHGSFAHLISNTFPLLFLGATLFYFYKRIALKILMACYFITGIVIWLFARPSFHIGASGLIYAIAAFLVFFGIFRKDLRSLFVSIIIIILYGGMVYGILPIQPGVSWESHLFGGAVGTVMAYRYQNYRI